jgi:hypothetical protein
MEPFGRIMSPLRYLLDENVDPLYANELIQREPAPVVWRIGAPGAPLKGTSDPDLLIWCEAEYRDRIAYLPV